MKVVFCPVLFAVVTRNRTSAENALALVAIKAHKTMQAAGWPSDAIDRDAHSILYGPQVVFSPGLPPAEIALRLQFASPFIINSETDVTQTGAWVKLREKGEKLYTKLESSVLQSRRYGPEVAIAGAIFTQIRNLMFSFFNLRATLLLPLAETPDYAPSAAAIRNIAGGYIDQAVALPGCLKAMDDMLEALNDTSQCSDEATVMDNAACVAISRGFLLGLLVGNQPAHMTQLLETHVRATPTISALHGPTLASMLLAGPQAAALAATLMGQPAAPPPPQYVPVVPRLPYTRLCPTSPRLPAPRRRARPTLSHAGRRPASTALYSTTPLDPAFGPTPAAFCTT